jgi:hypothetical protein
MSTTVFISSTSRDLLDHRAAVAKALLNAGYHPIDMANFMARPQGATTACLKEVAESDLFVGIYAWRYGYIPQGAAASITEQEFIEAERLGKPCFIFMVDETYTWPEAFKESGQAAQLLQAFKTRLDLKLVRTLFTSPEDLAMKVLASLQRYERDHRPQAERANSPAATPVAPAQSSRQSSIGGVNFSGISGGSISIGGNISSNVTAGGDIVAGDKIGGPAVAADSPQGQLVSALAQWQKEIEAKINALSELDDDEKSDLKDKVGKVREEAIKGAEANPGKLERLLNTMASMAPDILEVTAKTLQNPFAGVGLVLEKIGDRAKLEKK